MKTSLRILALAVIVTLLAMQSVDAQVVERWAQLYNGASNGDDYSRAVAVDAAGNVIVTGGSGGGVGGADIFTAKYAEFDGTLIWEHRYNGPANSGDQGTAVAVDGTGNVIVAGDSVGGSGNTDYYIAKYAATDGTLIWEKRYNGTGNGDDYATALALDSLGNAVVTGYSRGNGSGDDIYTAKYAAVDGTLIWEKRHNGPANIGDQARAVAVDSVGNVIITGFSAGIVGGTDYYTAKYAASDGELIWERYYDEATEHNTDRATALAVDSAGNVIVTGDSKSRYDGVDYCTVKYAAANGAMVWEKRFDGGTGFPDQATAVAVDTAGNAIVTGWAPIPGGGTGFYTAKYAAADGALVWGNRYDGPSHSSRAHAVVVDNAGNAIVAGSGEDYLTVKYAAADGALIWEKRYDGPGVGGNVIQERKQLAPTPDGGVVVTGYTVNGGRADYATVRYGPPVPPTVSTDPATLITFNSATLNATVTPNWAETTVHFDYGQDTNYGTTTPTQQIGSGTASVAISAPVAGLLPHTTYHFRAMATNSAGTTNGDDVTFTTANTMPVANGDAVELPMNHYNVKANDTDGDGDALTVTGVGAAAHGTATLHGDNTVSYTPGATFTGADNFTYTISDSFGGTATATVSVADTTPPVISAGPGSRMIRAASDEVSIVLGDLTGEVVATDNIGVTGITQNPPSGTVLGVGAHNVTLTVRDAAGNTAVAGLVVTVTPGNKTPIALPDFVFSTTSGALIDVLENDSDADGQALAITAVTQSPQGGLVTIEGGKVRYKPVTAVTTTRTFTYTISDGEDSATATVTIYRFPSLGFTYAGHLYDVDGTTIRGLLYMKVANAGGTFTGTVFLGAKKYGLKGSFSTDSPTLARAGASQTFAGIPVLISAGPLDGAGFPQIAFSVAGTVPGTRWRGVAERSPYFNLSAINRLLAPAAGKYTMIFAQPAGSAQPVVAGGCVSTVKSVGSATFAGKFGNGASVSSATYLLSGGRALFYAPAAKGAAFQTLAGTLVYAPAVDRDVSGAVKWTVPNGFESRIPGGLMRDYPVVGSRYPATLTSRSRPNLMLDFNVAGLATFTFDLLGGPVSVQRNIGAALTINGPFPMPQVKFAPSSGAYYGTYKDHAQAPTRKFYGWVLQHPAQNRGAGYVLEPSRIGSVSLTPAP